MSIEVVNVSPGAYRLTNASIYLMYWNDLLCRDDDTLNLLFYED